MGSELELTVQVPAAQMNAVPNFPAAVFFDVGDGQPPRAVSVCSNTGGAWTEMLDQVYTYESCAEPRLVTAVFAPFEGGCEEGRELFLPAPPANTHIASTEAMVFEGEECSIVESLTLVLSGAP